jgi:hypothetical protein
LKFDGWSFISKSLGERCHRVRFKSFSPEYRLYPLRVHPEFAERILVKVTRRMLVLLAGSTATSTEAIMTMQEVKKNSAKKPKFILVCDSLSGPPARG